MDTQDLNSCSQVLVFLLLGIPGSENVFCPVLQFTDDSQCVLNWMVGLKQQVFLSVLGFSIDLYFQVATGPNQNLIEPQPVFLGVFPGELDIWVHCVYMVCEDNYFLDLDFNPSIIHIPEPVGCCYLLEGAECFLLSFFHIQASNNGGTGDSWYNRVSICRSHLYR